MKKYKLLLAMIFISMFSVTVYALSPSFNFDSSKLSFSTKSKTSKIVDKFDGKYNLSYSLKNENSKVEEEIKELTKKTTYLLLGDFNNENESSENYYKRHKDYKEMAAYNYFPKDKNSSSGYDESNPLYKYVIASELAIPQLFNSFNELGILYNSYGDIRVTISGDLIISTLTLPDVKIKSEDKDNPINYKIEKTNLIIYYYFIKINGTYRLTYLYGETTDNVNKYFNEVEDNETKKTMAMVASYESNLSNVYNFDKLNSLSDDKINYIYNLNKANIVYLRSYYNNKVISNANGIFINDGIIMTTWSFIEKALINSQYLTIKDSDGKTYEMDGIITANPETDVVVIKLKGKNGNYVKLGNKGNIKIEDPAITISSKSGTGLTIQKGIVIADGDYVQTSIPLTKSDEGSPLFDSNGNLIGMNTSKSVDSSISISINLDVIKEIQDKFNSINYGTIKTISFEDLKKEYYTKYDKEKIINKIPNSKWDNYKKIGDIENTINLQIVKASYKDGVVSLRYKNNISNYISSMQLSASFKEKLISNGYKQKMNSSSKCIYENGDYQVVIMDEFDYLIVVMVKL
jgi:serine protease Do